MIRCIIVTLCTCVIHITYIGDTFDAFEHEHEHEHEQNTHTHTRFILNGKTLCSNDERKNKKREID
jgi:hypothetical protein